MNSLSSIRHIDMNILLHLDDKSLSNMTCLNKYILSLYNNNVFWAMKIKYLYHDIPIPSHYRQTLKKFYQDLVHISKSSCISDPRECIADWACKHGHINILQWLANDDIYPNKSMNFFPYMNGHIDVVKWLIDNDRYPDTYCANIAASNNHVDILEYISIHTGVYPDEKGLEWALENGKMETLIFLNKHNIKLTVSMMNSYIYSEPELSNFISACETFNIYPDSLGVSVAVRKNRTDILEWLSQYDIYPGPVDIYADIRTVSLDVLKLYVKEPSQYINQQYINWAAVVGRIDILSWLAESKRFPDKDCIMDVYRYSASNNKYSETIEWLEKYNII